MRCLILTAALLGAIVTSPSVCAGAPAGPPILSSGDESAVRALMEKYRLSWLANDADGVRSVFSPNAVIMPHHGLSPAVGSKAISDFWFPPNAPKTTILKYERTIDEISGDGSLAYVRGQSEVAWMVDNKGVPEHWKTSGTYLAILNKDVRGRWWVSVMSWDDTPNQKTG
jgi:uncharacterized protein (TIGR02246 family)